MHLSYRMVDLGVLGATSAHLPMLKGCEGSSLAMLKMEQPRSCRSRACPDLCFPGAPFEQFGCSRLYTKINKETLL